MTHLKTRVLNKPVFFGHHKNGDIMYFIICLILLLVFFPWPIYFEIDADKISVYGLSFRWENLKRTQKKDTFNRHWTKKRAIKNILKGLRLKKLELHLGYQCEMIDESMYLYGLYLAITSMLYTILRNMHVKVVVDIQNLPLKKSYVKGMIELCLAKIMLESLRRLRI